MTDPATINYGTDLAGVTDLTPEMRETSRRHLLLEALARRLITPRGRLLDDPNYGFDLTGELNDDIGPTDIGRIQSGIEAEMVKDERVQSARATVTLVPGAIPRQGALVVNVNIQDKSGPFSFVLSVGNVTVTLLSTSGV